MDVINSNPNFFNNGLTIVLFQCRTNTACSRHAFINFVISSMIVGRICFSTPVGIGSNSHEVVFMSMIILVISVGTKGANIIKLGGP